MSELTTIRKTQDAVAFDSVMNVNDNIDARSDSTAATDDLNMKIDKVRLISLS